METLLFDSLDSTQKYLVDKIQTSELKAPIAVQTLVQKNGIGSRNNKWVGIEGNYFASVAIKIEDLPSDLALHSASIYFSFIMKKTLEKLGENIWLKWPNDFYKNDDKVGGTITKKVNDTLVCGIGINLKKSQNGYNALQNDISPKVLLERYLLSLEKYPKWKDIFREYKVEFELSRKFSVHIENYEKGQYIDAKQSLEEALLQDDGSLIINEKKVFSLR
ncbi:MAG: biotin--[acetyl-CoA-carboxylase] ligase [Sulfurovum sp.]|nr:biotin--[acetyl-CoA-carboxylase] ligase [Sulfurovum sp.]